MAGRPKLRAFAERIEREGGDDVILDLIREGMTLTKVGERFDVSRTMIRHWAALTEERKRAFEEAKIESADVLADRATGLHEDLMELAEPAPGRVSATKNAADHFMRLAAIRNRDEYGDGPTASETLADMGALFLEALREHGRVVRHDELQALPGEPVQEAEFELEEDEMATPRMQRKLDALAAAEEVGVRLSARQLEQVADGEPITEDPPEYEDGRPSSPADAVQAFVNRGQNISEPESVPELTAADLGEDEDVEVEDTTEDDISELL